MIYGYARVSTAAQDESGQVKQLKAAGCGRIFREKVTGTTADRPQLAKLMKALAPGDIVITPAVDRRALPSPSEHDGAGRRRADTVMASVSQPAPALAWCAIAAGFGAD